MATVYMSNDNIEAIVAQTKQLYEQDRQQLGEHTFPTIEGDEIYGWIMPLDAQKQVLDLMPEQLRATSDSMYLRVGGAQANGWDPVLHLDFKEARLYLGHLNGVVDVEWAKSAYWDGETLYLHIEDETKIPQGQAGDLIRSMYKIAAQHNKITTERDESGELMRKFISQHRTVQSAIKASGPALLEYVPHWMKEELKRKPLKRTRHKVEVAEKEEVNINKLIARATIKRLNIKSGASQ